jgi:pilus assembly protein CpaE
MAVLAMTSHPPAVPERHGVLAVLGDGETCSLVTEVLSEQNITGSSAIEGGLDIALAQLQAGYRPVMLLLDITGSTTPVADVTAAVAAGGAGLRVIAVGEVNDVHLFRELIAAGAGDYLVKPLNPYALGVALADGVRPLTPVAGTARLGKTLVFMGARGGVGATTAAVSTAWLLAHQHSQRTALIDLDLYFGTVALSLDLDPGRGLREALEQPSRIDGLFIERAMVKESDRLSVLSAEEPMQDDAIFDPSAIDILLHEVRQKFDWIVIDLPRGATMMQRIALTTATHVAIVCDQSLAGLRDAMRVQALATESAPNAQILFVDGGAAGGVPPEIARPAFEKGLGRPFDWVLPTDPKAAAAAANAGKPLPAAVAGSPTVKALKRYVATLADARPSVKKQPFWKRGRG